jgi:hypothetical protein
MLLTPQNLNVRIYLFLAIYRWRMFEKIRTVEHEEEEDQKSDG